MTLVRNKFLVKFIFYVFLPCEILKFHIANTAPLSELHMHPSAIPLTTVMRHDYLYNGSGHNPSEKEFACPCAMRIRGIP